MIISLLLISAVGAVAFGVARVMFVETAGNAVRENGAIAYYASESGIEEGFLRYRFNRNTEVPFLNWNLDANADRIYRSNLSDGEMVTGVPAGDSISQAISDNSKSFYDLRMGHLGTMVGDDPTNFSSLYRNRTLPVTDPNYASGDYDFLKIAKDDSQKFDLTNYNLNNSFMLELNYRSSNTGTWTPDEKCKIMAEAVLTYQPPADPETHQIKALLSLDPDACSVSTLAIPASKFFTYSQSAPVYYNSGGAIDSVHFQYDNFLSGLFNGIGQTVVMGTKLSLSIKPLYHDVEIAFGSHDCGLSNAADDGCKDQRDQMVSGPYSTITSVGYYGGVTKKLVANIDRQSGTLYDLFDYVIFSAN